MRVVVTLGVLPTALGALAIAFAIASFVATARRTWRPAERLAFAAIASGLATPLFACVAFARFAPIGRPDAASNATMLAALISELMNCTAFALPGVALGLVALGIVVWRRPRPEKPQSSIERV